MEHSVVQDVAGLNQALFEVTHGLYILTAKGEKVNGQCIDALMQVTNMPPRVALCTGKQSLTYEMIASSGLFAVNVIDREREGWMDLVQRFGFQSGRKVDKFADFPYEEGEYGLPLLREAKAFYECKVIPELGRDLGTHMLFVASVERAGTLEHGEPLTYYEYRKVRFKKN
jgi:flavin reductase (DIM6/NTAB) family NADH-FMN oxidoreductase RutF